MRFDLPGVDASALDIAVERNVPTVTGERRSGMQEGDVVIVAERPMGTLSLTTVKRPA